jgi:putative endonuclease
MSQKPTRAESGAAAEAYVAGRLARAGYRIVERNWRTRGGEIDIVALNDDILVFIEVRARSSDVVTAEDSVDTRKLGFMLRAGEWYVETHAEFHDTIWRVDLVAIALDRSGAIRSYRHYENLTME